MRTGRFVGPVLLVLTTSMAFLHAAPAGGDDKGDAYVEDDGDLAVEAEQGDTRPNASQDPTEPQENCEYRVYHEDDIAFALYDVDGTRLFSETGRWLQPVCNGTTRPPFPEGGPVDPRALALQARDSASIPGPPMKTSPSSDARLYTQLATWLWIDGDWWRTYSATATAGRVSATITGEPTSAVWDMGDGHVVMCSGPGVEWRRGMDDGATYCKHTYRHSSAGQPNGTYPMSVTVTFEISWTSNVDMGGSLDTVSRQSATDVEVGEIQGLETE